MIGAIGLSQSWNPTGWILLSLSLVAGLGAAISVCWRTQFLYNSGASGRLNTALKKGKKVIAKVQAEANEWNAQKVVAISTKGELDAFTKKLYKWKNALRIMEGHSKGYIPCFLCTCTES